MLVVIRGAGDIASGIALRLFRAGMRVVMCDLPVPTSIRRTVCFSEAIRLGETSVEGVRGVLCATPAAARAVDALASKGYPLVLATMPMFPERAVRWRLEWAGIDPDKKLWEVVSGGTDYMMVGETEVPSRAYVAAFGFKGADQQKPAGVLSGGERNRLNLALTLRQGGNLLLLDEPTNDLDVETLESLEEALEEFPGCSVVISHDRWFLDRVATHILAWEGDDEHPGRWHWFEGNFEAYQADRERRLGAEASKPHRLHRKLTRD